MLSFIVYSVPSPLRKCASETKSKTLLRCYHSMFAVYHRLSALCASETKAKTLLRCYHSLFTVYHCLSALCISETKAKTIQRCYHSLFTVCHCISELQREFYRLAWFWNAMAQGIICVFAPHHLVIWFDYSMHLI